MPAGKSRQAKIPVMMMEMIIRSSQITSRCQNFTGTSVPMQQGTKEARKMMEETGRTASMKRSLMLHSPAATSRAGTVTSTREIIAPVQAVVSSAPVKPKMRKKGQKISMNWNAVPGARGRCKVSKRSFKNRDSKDLWTNDIDKFYAPEDSDLPFQTNNLPQQNAPATGGYTVGKF